MFYAIIGCIIGVLLILAWWHRVLLVLYMLIAMLWLAMKLGWILPLSWNKWIMNKLMYHPLIIGLSYAVREVEDGKLGGHLFDD